MNKGFLKVVSVLLLGAMLAMSARAQNYRVKAERYERGTYSPETNPASVRYAIIDLGPDVEPIRLSNSGHVLCQPAKQGKLQSRWYQGQFQELTGGDDSLLVGTLDMNNEGTVVGGILEYKAGTVSGPQHCIDSEYAWYRRTSYGIRRAVKWEAGSGAAIPLGQPKFAYSIFDCTNPDGPPYEGFATFGGPWTIDDNGHIYGEAYGDYQQFRPITADGPQPTVWGWFASGYDFSSGTVLGDQSLVLDASNNTYSVIGKPTYVRKVRNGVTTGYNGKGQNLVNDVAVDFVPTTMNSQGLVLGAVVVNLNSFFGYTKFLIYDPATRTQTNLPMRASRFFGPGQFHPPVALNHRTITVTNSSGQIFSKVSPQIVGPEGAVLWEENPKTGQYFSQSLNLLIPEDSGWNLTSAKAINDNGVILCKGNYQGQPRACLLWPMNSVYVFFGASAFSGKFVDSHDLTPQRELNTYLDQVKWTEARDGYYPVFAGAQTAHPYVLVKGTGPNAAFARVYVYDSVNATRAQGFQTMLAMRNALSTSGSYVTFNGHANMGVGPAFTLDVGDLGGFMHISNSVAAVSAVELTTEGYNFALRPYVPNDPANEILATTRNYVVPFVGQLRFPNNEGVDEGEFFSLRGSGALAYHYELTTREEEGADEFTLNFTLVHAGASDLPSLGYKWFYFDACNSGRDYIEPFQHGSFFYTADFYGDIESTRTFVAAVVEGKREEQAVSDINSLRPFEVPVNVFHRFP